MRYSRENQFLLNMYLTKFWTSNYKCNIFPAIKKPYAHYFFPSIKKEKTITSGQILKLLGW